MLSKAIAFVPPYVWACLLVAALLFSFYCGWRIKTWQADAETLAVMVQLDKEIDAKTIKQQNINRASVTEHQEKEIVIRNHYRTIYKEIANATTDTGCFTDDAAELYNRALQGSSGETDSTGVPEGTRGTNTAPEENR